MLLGFDTPILEIGATFSHERDFFMGHTLGPMVAIGIQVFRNRTLVIGRFDVPITGVLCVHLTGAVKRDPKKRVLWKSRVTPVYAATYSDAFSCSKHDHIDQRHRKSVKGAKPAFNRLAIPIPYSLRLHRPRRIGSITSPQFSQIFGLDWAKRAPMPTGALHQCEKPSRGTHTPLSSLNNSIAVQ